MNTERELMEWLGPWLEASEQVETAPSEDCLAAAEIAAFVDGDIGSRERRRATAHLSQCSYCAREVGSLFRIVKALQNFGSDLRSFVERQFENFR